jgi:ribosomal protein S24E
MSMIEVTRDVKNLLLSRREITCNFKGLSGRLKKLEAVDMISKKFNLEGKIVIPILLKNETGRPVVSGSFYVYEDEKLAKEHLKAAVFARIEKAKEAAAKAEGEAASAAQAEAPKEETK